MHRQRSIHFDLFRDANTASSRLRGFALAQELRERGFQVSACAHPSKSQPDADVFVFQKVVPRMERVVELKREGKRIIFDIDDNYLLDDVGQKRDILSFINAVDVVTVGSKLLLETIRPYHDRVVLFENPLDVLPQSLPKKPSLWTGRLGWFGNRCNLPALEQLPLPGKVSTITSGGDIEWKLESVDQELVNFDVILIPVIQSKWNYSKNANRMLKCVALGVPFLASATPEHVAMVERLGLNKERFLVADSEDWSVKISAVQADYFQVLRDILAARNIAKSFYAIEALTTVWIDTVLKEQPRAPLNLTSAQRDWFAQLNVVILDEYEATWLQHTVGSLRLAEVTYGAIRVVSPRDRKKLGLPDAVELVPRGDDFFAIYPQLCETLAAANSGRVLFIRAGVAFGRGFFHRAPQTSAPLAFFTGQHDSPSLKFIPPAPTQLDRLLVHPYVPFLMLIDAELARTHLPCSNRFGALGLWNFLIRVYTESKVTPSYVNEPVVTAMPGALRGTSVDHYTIWCREHDSGVAKDLPAPHVEWQRLQRLWHGMVISNNHELFSQYCSIILPMCAQRGGGTEAEARHDTNGFTEIQMIHEAFRVVDRSQTFRRLIKVCAFFSTSFRSKWKQLRSRINKANKLAKKFEDLN